MNLDTQILYWIQESMYSPAMTSLMKFITHLSSGGLFEIAVCLILLIRKETRNAGWVMLIALALDAVLVNAVIKPIVNRPRPYEALGLPILISPPSGSSFPSGHTSIAFTMAASMLLTLKSRTGRVLSWIAVAFACVTGLTRLYFFVHYPSDVLAGAVIGILCAAAAVPIFKKVNALIEERRNRP